MRWRLAPWAWVVALFASSGVGYAQEASPRPAEPAVGAAPTTSAAPAGPSPAAPAPSDAPAGVGAPAAGPGDAPGTATDAAPRPQDEEPSDDPDTVAVRRSDFTFGLMVGGAFGGASGYPNDAIKMGLEQYYTNTGVGLGGTAGSWFGGTFTDWFTFAIGINVAMLASGDHNTQCGSFGFHIEAFPTWPLGGEWQEVGVQLETGVGLFQTRLIDDDSVLVVDSGGSSRFALGVFYEGIRAWRISMGPLVGMDLMWSPSAFRPMGIVAWRTVLYSGP